MAEHVLSAEQRHYAWDNSLEPRLEVEPGDGVTVHTWDANAHYYTRASTSLDAAHKPAFRGHALTGPIYVRGASAGQTLVVEVREVRPDSFGFTAFYPGRGLLPDDFSAAYLRVWDLGDGRVGRGLPGVQVPLAPFCGIMGVALAAPGEHSTMPPRRVGGNMDVKQLTAGSTLYLPIEVDGALLSLGDAHGAQGDGEVCITAIEMDSTTSIRIGLLDQAIAEPQLDLPGPPTTIPGPYHGCTAHAPDLLLAAQNATRHAIDWLCRTYGLSPEDAYVTCSVAAELRISQVVDAPNWTVTAFLPLAVFR